MPNYYALEVMKREAKGSAAARRLRREGKIPAVFYSHGKENLNLVVNAKDFYTALHTGQHIFETKLDGKRQFLMVKEVQYHPVTDQIIHVDLMGVKNDRTGDHYGTPGVERRVPRSEAGRSPHAEPDHGRGKLSPHPCTR